MGLGILLMVITAVWWVILGAIISNSAKKNLNLAFIQGGGAVVTMLLTLPIYFIGSLKIPVAVLVAVPLSGFLNFFAFDLMNRAMKTGPNGMIWAMIQSAFVLPFLMGVIFFDVPCPFTRIIGLVLILAAMVLMGIFGQSNEVSGEKKYVWVFITVIAYLFAGLTQCSVNLPSYLISNSGGTTLLNVLFRMGLSSSGFFIGYLVNGIGDRSKYSWKGCIPSTILMTLTVILSLFTTFIGLDRLAKYNIGSIGFPVVVGTSIVFFTIYTSIQLKEKLSPSGIFSILLCLAGIVVISL